MRYMAEPRWGLYIDFILGLWGTGAETYWSCATQDRTSLVGKFPCYWTHHLSIWSSLPLAYASPCPLCTWATFRFNLGSSQSCEPANTSYVMGFLVCYFPIIIKFSLSFSCVSIALLAPYTMYTIYHTLMHTHAHIYTICLYVFSGNNFKNIMPR